MQLILLRHADKVLSGSDNPGLSAKGLEQAKFLAPLLQGLGSSAAWLVQTSPKIRAQSTLKPFCDLTKNPLWIEKGLDERQLRESGDAFQIRVSRTLDKAVEQASERGLDQILLCSHLDWLETAMLALSTDLDSSSLEWPHHWTCCHYVQFTQDGSLWRYRSQGDQS